MTDWTAYKPLLAEATQKMIALTMRTQLAAQPPDVEKCVACLQDGTIDAGDFEQVSQGLLKIIVGMSEYQDVVRFTKERARDYGEMYRALGNAGPEDFAAFLELNERIAVEAITETLFKLLVASEVLVDKRSA